MHKLLTQALRASIPILVLLAPETIAEDRLRTDPTVALPSADAAQLATVGADQLGITDGRAVAIQRFSVSGVRSDAAGLADGTQILVGRNPSGALAGAEGQIARLSRGAWVFQDPKPGDQVFDEDTGEQYLFTGRPLLFDGLWLDSEWRRLTSERVRWQQGGLLSTTTALDASDHGRWFAVSAEGGDMTIILPSPFAGDLEAMSMEIVVEPFDGASGTATLDVQGHGAIMTPDGQLVSRFDLPRDTGRSHVFRLVAGNLGSTASWYVIRGL